MYIKDLFSPKAKQLLTDEIFWDTSNEFAPFGSDEGFDTFWIFEDWLRENPGTSVKVYVYKLMEYYELDMDDILRVQVNHPVDSCLVEDFDAEITAVCFGQLILEGLIDELLLKVTRAALNRQASTFVLDYRIDSEMLKAERKMILETLLLALDKFEDAKP